MDAVQTQYSDLKAENVNFLWPVTGGEQMFEQAQLS